MIQRIINPLFPTDIPKWKIIVPGGAAGLQIQMGPPAVLGRFDSCDLPPLKFNTTPLIPKISITNQIYALLMST